jgi:hypothetical protein
MLCATNPLCSVIYKYSIAYLYESATLGVYVYSGPGISTIRFLLIAPYSSIIITCFYIWGSNLAFSFVVLSG